MRILVTGASGFIGSNTANLLIDGGHEVVAIGNDVENPVPRAQVFLSSHLTGVRWDQIGEIDAVVHQAANNNTLDNNEGEMLQANLYAPIKMFRTALDHGCRKFIFASSTAVYGNSPAPYIEGKTELKPLNVYGKSKLLFEEWAMQFGYLNKVSTIGLRYCNVYGPGEQHKGHRASMIYQMANQILHGQVPSLFKWGEQKRDWIYVADVAKANAVSLEYTGSGIFNCGQGAAISFADMFGIIKKAAGVRAEAIAGPTYIDNPYAERYQTFTECDMRAIKSAMGFVPQHTTEYGINLFVQHLMRCAK